MNAAEAMAMTVGRIALEHYLPEKRRRRRANTVDGYESSIRCHVLPRWGEKSLGEVTRDDVQEWVDELGGTPAGPGGTEKAYKCLRQIVRWAMDKWGLYMADPTRGIELPRKRAYRPETLTQRRLKRWIRGMVGCECEATAVLQSALGCRPGENYHLSWPDINWRTGAVPLDGSLQETSEGLRDYPTKTAKGERTGFLPPWALDRLHQIWVALGRPKGRIIGCLSPSQVAYRIKTWAQRRKLPKVTMKNLRHTWGTLAAQAGVAIQDCAAMMGHSDIQTTYRYYYALTAAQARRAQRKVARAVMGKTCEDMYAGVNLRFTSVPAPMARAA